MLVHEQLKAVSGFLIDCAKIIFASFVVGAFAPSFSGPEPVKMFVAGTAFTLIFLIMGISLAKQS